MNSLESFSSTYPEARDKFIAAATHAGAALTAYGHPDQGPDGGALSTDVAWIGDRQAERVLVLISATHGVEGFAGSGVQIDWLKRGEHARLPPSVAALLIHAINPYGFAWLRRVTHENVDLNRNWIDFGGAPPANAGYEELAASICPEDWSAESRGRCGRVLEEYRLRHGVAAWQQALSGGQYRYPQGIFYGGHAPTWSRLTQTRIFGECLSHARQVGIIDFHTGLGPWGYGERIATSARGSAPFDRALSWYGGGVVSPFDGSSSSSPIVGDGLSASVGLLPHAEVTGLALEYGTVPVLNILEALRADAWLHAYGETTSVEGRRIKSEIRAAFYGDAPDWKGMIAGQGLLAIRQAVTGLLPGKAS